MDEDHRAARIFGVEKIEFVPRLLAVNDVERARRGFAEVDRVASPPFENGEVIGDENAVVVFGVEGGVYGLHAIS